MKIIASNKKARREYSLIDSYVAGVQLTGSEVKSARLGRAKISGAWVLLKPSGAYLIGSYFAAYQQAQTDDECYRTRKLLLKQAELDKLARAKNSGLQIVPVKMGIIGRYIKLEIATASPLKLHDKRHKISARRDSRETREALGK